MKLVVKYNSLKYAENEKKSQPETDKLKYNNKGIQKYNNII